MNKKQKRKLKMLLILIVGLSYAGYMVFEKNKLEAAGRLLEQSLAAKEAKKSADKAEKLKALAGKKRVRALVAAKDLLPGFVVKPGDMSWRYVEASKLGTDAITEDTKRDTPILGSRIQTRLSRGSPILESYLAPAPAGSILAAAVKPGMIAAAISIKRTILTASLGAGDHVDLVFTHQVLGRPESVIFLRNILLLSTSGGSGEEGNISLVLELPRRMALALESSKSVGEISVMLRGKRKQLNAEEGKKIRQITSDDFINEITGDKRSSPQTVTHIQGSSKQMGETVIRHLAPEQAHE